ncbi:MAG: hypothetical protein ACXWYP_06565 [Pseudonocardia sp.]
MPPPTRRPGALTTLVALLAVVLAACATAKPADPGPDAPTGHWRWTPQADRLQLGVTHTRKSLDPHHPDGARDRGVAILEHGAVWQNHHLMGFGTLNPQPAPGEYDWESLDRRMRLTEDTGARTVLTLCCAPDWMKGGAPGETDWSRLEDDPLPAHFADFAALAAAAVQRYPQVERVLVWNELKGFYRSDLNRWDQEGYTALYNEVYRAVKAARPDVKIGGPYVVLSSLDEGRPNASDLRGPWGAIDSRALAVVDHWLAHKAGADFVAVDGNTKTREGTRPVNVDVGARKYAAVDRWLRARTDLPIWWAEFYPDVPDGVTAGPQSPASAAATLAAVAAYAETGARAALLWGPQADDIAYAALWTDRTEPGGGRPTPLTAAWRWLVPRLADGRVQVGRSPDRSVVAFRADDGQVLANLTAAPVDPGEGRAVLPAWGIDVPDDAS